MTQKIPMEYTRSRKSKKEKFSKDRNVVCCVCGGEQKDQYEKFRTCSGCKEKLGMRRYFCSRTCQKTDWKTHREWCGSLNFWEYPHKPLLIAEADFERPAALRCQIALIDSDPDVLYTIAPCTDDVVRFTICDRMLNVSFRRIRDQAFTTRDPELITVLGQVFVDAIQNQEEAESRDQALTAQRVDTLFNQLEEEYDVPDIADMVFDLLEEQSLDPLGHSRLQNIHQENMSKHPSDFWKGMARTLD
ncbi:hypothetical protein B0H19DRAFT_1180560 [Mycena capillaripes]|nr:hypothetical protein B0H19DRAFT_1180560 [Mycena capillaripes]